MECGMLNALFVALDGADPDGVARATASMQRQGFAAAAAFAWDAGALHAWTRPAAPPGEATWARAADGMACCVGPVWYRGQFGNLAVRLLLDEAAAGTPIDESALRGNFALFMQTREHCLLLNDMLGLVRIYASADGRFYSTSWLAACAYAGRVELDAAAAIEYVLLGASHSDNTVACGVTTLPLACVFDLHRRSVRKRPRVWEGAIAAAPVTLDTAVTSIAAHLQRVFGEVAAAFPSRLRAALSGGFDSRLILAGLLDAGEHPELFVYGDAASDDVVVARAVAAATGMHVAVIDKAVLDRDRPLPDLEQLLANALFFDGLPNDGILDRGADGETRLAQTAGGWLALNGGGGEIFRNFFHLPDRRFSASDLVRAFYRGFERRVFRRARDLDAYEQRLAAAIGSTLEANGSASQRLPREQVELVYPLFRCHHWMAVNNSVAVRHGCYTTPLLDPVSVGLAWRLPLAWKQAGLLESRLITHLHHGVADENSTYGFRFTAGPDTKARCADWGARARPVAMRPLIGALGRRLRNRVASPQRLTHCRGLLPGEWRVDALLDLRHLPDDQALGRALAVELAWRELLR
jgi:asparagine synthase (glutamine-hydrolysing)